MGSASGKQPDRWRWPRRIAFAVLIPLAVLTLLVRFAVVGGSWRGAKTEWVTKQLRALQGAAQVYQSRTGRWPDSVATLRKAHLLPSRTFPTEPAGLDANEDVDPWGRPFVLTPKGANLEIRSQGDDGPDPDDDVVILVKVAPPRATP